MMHSLLRVLRSGKLGLSLLPGLALFSVIGTIPSGDVAPAQAPGFLEYLLSLIGVRNTFSSPLFLAVVFVFCANIIACTAHRFRLHKKRGPLLILDVLMHLALLVLAVGGVLRVVGGSVSTMSVEEGHETREIYDWGVKRYVPLGYTLRVERVVMEHYPMSIKVGVIEVGSGKRVALLQILEGHDNRVDGADVGVRFLGADRVEQRVGAVLSGRQWVRDESGSIYAVGRERPRNMEVIALRCGFCDEIKMVRALLSINSADGLPIKRWLAPNERVRINGASIFLTAWSTDPFGNRFAGLQVTKDPAAPVFWTGCLLFVAALFGRVMLKLRERRG